MLLQTPDQTFPFAESASPVSSISDASSPPDSSTSAPGFHLDADAIRRVSGKKISLRVSVYAGRTGHLRRCLREAARKSGSSCGSRGGAYENRQLGYIYWSVLNRILGLCFNSEVNRNVVPWFIRFKGILKRLSSAASSAPN